MIERKVGDTKFQGSDEEIIYSLLTTNWGSDPTDVVIKAYNITTGARVDVSDTVLFGTVNIVGDLIVLPLVKGIVPFDYYRIEIKFSSGGNVFETYFEIIGEF